MARLTWLRWWPEALVLGGLVAPLHGSSVRLKVSPGLTVLSESAYRRLTSLSTWEWDDRGLGWATRGALAAFVVLCLLALRDRRTRPVVAVTVLATGIAALVQLGGPQPGATIIRSYVVAGVGLAAAGLRRGGAASDPVRRGTTASPTPG